MPHIETGVQHSPLLLALLWVSFFFGTFNIISSWVGGWNITPLLLYYSDPPPPPPSGGLLLLLTGERRGGAGAGIAPHTCYLAAYSSNQVLRTTTQVPLQPPWAISSERNYQKSKAVGALAMSDVFAFFYALPNSASCHKKKCSGLCFTTW